MTAVSKPPKSSSEVSPTLLRHVDDHREDMRDLVRQVVDQGGLTEVRYARLLSCLVHFTRGVQRHFYALAGHDALARRKALREFLVRFANEEEWHWRVALADLQALGHELHDAPIEVDLWWVYFDRMVAERPFVRLGATALLENLGDCIPAGGTGVMDRPFLRRDTLRFYRIHHDDEHGAEVLAALAAAKPTDEEWRDMVRGAEVARRLHLGGMRWALLGHGAEACEGAA